MNLPLTAAILIIGDEILSGQTRDTNSHTLAYFLAGRGIDLTEIRVVGDEIPVIAEAVNALRTKYRYVFTTGGIGPTHDDVTTDAVAAAFGVPVAYDPVALEMLASNYEKPTDLNDARRRMARIPKGGSLIANPVSGAPGYQIENVFVLAGVPKIMQAMLEDLAPRLGLRPPKQSVMVVGQTSEGPIADALARLAASRPDLAIGSYPGRDAQGKPFVRLVARSRDKDALADIALEFKHIFQFVGANIDPKS